MLSSALLDQPHTHTHTAEQALIVVVLVVENEHVLGSGQIT